MKNVIVYTLAERGGGWKRALPLEAVRIYLNFQIENQLVIGWKREEIVIVTNFAHEHEGVRAWNLGDYFGAHAGGCLSKHLGAHWALMRFSEPIYLHDHDCYEFERMDADAVLGGNGFVVSGGKPPRISDQSCFMAPSFTGWLGAFLERQQSLPNTAGAGFRLGEEISQCAQARITPYEHAPWRCNLVSPTWRKDIQQLVSEPLVMHQKLADSEAAGWLAETQRWSFLARYASFSAMLPIMDE